MTTNTPEPRDRRWLLWTLAAVVGIIALAVGVAYSPLLDIQHVDVEGVPPERVGAVRDAAGLEPGDSIVTFVPGSVAGKVRHLPWVASASVTRDLPATVRIRVVSREPVAWVAMPPGVLVVDAGSRVLWRADAPPPGVPELRGVADVASPGGDVRPVVLARAAAAMPSALRSRSAWVALDDGTLSVQVILGPALRFGAPTEVAQKARVASAVLDALGPTRAAYIDVTVPTAPVSG